MIVTNIINEDHISIIKIRKCFVQLKKSSLWVGYGKPKYYFDKLNDILNIV